MTRSNDPPIKVTREIPLPWLITAVVACVGWAISQYIAAQKIADATVSLSARVAVVSEQMRQKDIGDARTGVRLDEHERRIAQLENASGRKGR